MPTLVGGMELKMKDITFRDLVDISVLQSLQDGFAQVTGLATLTADMDAPISNVSLPLGVSLSQIPDKSLGFNPRTISYAAADSAAVKTTPDGLARIEAPVMLNGQKVGTLIAAQVAGTTPNVNGAASFLYGLAKMLSKSVQDELKNITIREEGGNAVTTAEMLTLKVNQITRLMALTSENSKKLSENFSALRETADNSVRKVADTSETVKKIQDIAMNTRILGFNASIEASRAKESGKGFGVIAQEVRSLAEVSKASADRIEGIIQAIGANTEDMNISIKKTGEIIERNLENANAIDALLKEITDGTNK